MSEQPEDNLTDLQIKALEKMPGDVPTPQHPDHSLHRVTFVAQLHHQVPGDDTYSIDLGHSWVCESTEQTWSRRQRIKNGGVAPFKGCWIEAAEVGMVVIRNVSNSAPLQKNPSTEEIEAAKQRTITVCLLYEDSYQDISVDIPPGSFFACHPTSLEDWWVTTPGDDQTIIHAYVLPR